MEFEMIENIEFAEKRFAEARNVIQKMKALDVWSPVTESDTGDEAKQECQSKIDEFKMSAVDLMATYYSVLQLLKEELGHQQSKIANTQKEIKQIGIRQDDKFDMEEAERSLKTAQVMTFLMKKEVQRIQETKRDIIRDGQRFGIELPDSLQQAMLERNERIRLEERNRAGNMEKKANKTGRSPKP